MKHKYILKKSSATENSKCQVPEAGTFLKCLWKIQKASVAEREQARGRMGVGKIRPGQDFRA